MTGRGKTVETGIVCISTIPGKNTIMRRYKITREKQGSCR